jgi:transcription antitermination protein nusG
MSKPRWYVVHVYSGSEKKVAESIREQAEKKNLKDKVLDVLVPTEQVIEVKRGEKVNSERQFFPGYILVQMEMTDESWHLVSSTAKVTGFLGGKGRPTPITQKEVDRLLAQIKDQEAKPKHAISFEIGEEVRVTDGPFSTFTGLVEDVDDEKERLKVSVSIFGRATPVELEFAQVEKV